LVADWHHFRNLSHSVLRANHTFIRRNRDVGFQRSKKASHTVKAGSGERHCSLSASVQRTYINKGSTTEALMTSQLRGQHKKRWICWMLLALALGAGSPAFAADEPDLIFRRSTVFKWISPNDKLATYGIDDPEVEGVACHFTVPEKGGFKGWLGLAEEVSDISLACRQVGPIHFKDKMEQGEDMFRKRRSLFFKKMQIVRGCDAKRNVLVYMVYSDKLIEGSPKNSTSSVPIMPWGTADNSIQKCGDFIQ
jgi:CreA protein